MRDQPGNLTRLLNCPIAQTTNSPSSMSELTYHWLAWLVVGYPSTNGTFSNDIMVAATLIYLSTS